MFSAFSYGTIGELSAYEKDTIHSPMVHHKYGEEYYHKYGEEYAPKMRAERFQS